MYDRIVQELIERAGMSENDIAMAVESSQPTIHRIKKGHAKFDVGVGDRLRALHAKTVGESSAPASGGSAGAASTACTEVAA